MVQEQVFHQGHALSLQGYTAWNYSRIKDGTTTRFILKHWKLQRITSQRESMIKVSITIVNFIKQQEFLFSVLAMLPPSYSSRAEISMIQRIVKVVIPQDQRILRDLLYLWSLVIILSSCADVAFPLPFPRSCASILISSSGYSFLSKGQQLLLLCLFLLNSYFPFSSHSV